LQNPPFKLSIDYSSSDGIEECDDGIWNIVGGKVRMMLIMLFPDGNCLFSVGFNYFYPNEENSAFQ